MKSNLERIKEIFARAAEEKSPVEREIFLAQACQGDPELRRQVDSLLRAHEEAGKFLGQGVELPLAGFASERPGTVIGRYKLLELIGEGGFGAVWMAEQEEPVRRRVALKVIKPGMDTKQVLARFEAERQALAMMDHPSIARVFDGGATETGRPYFVMELVRGARITDYCDANKLPTGERLTLFIQVCQAVQHAHQKGIIHRDLKPSNILITEVDGAPVPKVIDFGVAKAMQTRLTERTLFTGLHQMIGTPSYMSPEQAGMGALDMDTRSDIYALGVLLYELLTGQTPLNKEKFEKAGLDEIFRLIREQDPPKPSTRLSGLTREQLTAIAAQRQAEPLKLNRLLTGDLDWIVMKALEKDRRRRYETASGLAMDIRHHLQNEPVSACPPGNWYRLRKMVRRNKGAFTAVGAVAAALLAGSIVSTLLFLKEKEARRRATAAETAQRQLLIDARTARERESKLRQQAQDDEKAARQAEHKASVEAEKNRLSGEVLGGMFLDLVRGLYRSGNGPVLKSMLDEADDQVQEVKLVNQPEAKAYLLSIMSEAYLQIDEFAKAEALQRDALALLKSAPGDQNPDVGNSLAHLAEVLASRGQLAAAKTEYQAAVKQNPEITNSVQWVGLISSSGWFFARHEQWKPAADELIQAVNTDLADVQNWYVLMPVLIQAGRTDDYKARCHAILDRFSKTDLASTAQRGAFSCLLLPSAVDQNDLARAVELARKSITLSRPGSHLHWRLMAEALGEYRQSHFVQALETAGLAQKELLHARDPGWRMCQAETYFISAMAHGQLQQTTEARASLNRGLEIVRTKMPQLNSGDLGENWFDVLMTHFLLREATAAIDGPSVKQKL